MAINFSPPFVDLTFMAPLSEVRADQLVRFLAENFSGTVVDFGCGWAELLLRVLKAAPAARGVGLDINEPSITHGKELASARGLLDRVTLIAGDAHQPIPDSVDAAICIGASQIWGASVDEKRPLDYRAALTALRSLVNRGSRIVYGEGIWTAEPTDAAIAPLAGRRDELVFLPQLLTMVCDSGFMPIQIHEATLDEWDAFESGYAACYGRWLVEHTLEHIEVAKVHEIAKSQRTAYFSGYRGIMGMAYLALVAV